jgi:ectoine hydroxylase-related dioxygenase (phytanoyl-CoA dioxygenase family)
MYLTTEQLQSYEADGFLLLPECFSPDEVAVMKAQLPALFAEDSPRRVVEKDGNRVRSVYGAHTTNAMFARLCRSPRLVYPAKQILGSDVYVYQFKVNAKAAFDGDVWEWHQDYIFWLKEDGMPQPRVVNVVIFLDEVNEFNGPMFVIPGSHRQTVIDAAPNESVFEQDTVYRTGPAWISNLTASLKYTLDQQTVACMVQRYGMISPKGPAGSVLFFHCNLFHGSPNNMSPFDRAIAIATFNSTDNAPVGNGHTPRPDFLCSRDVRPIVPMADGSLL